MAFGTSPNYQERYKLDNLSKEQFLVIAVEASKHLEWKIERISDNGLIAHTPFSLSSWSEKVTVLIENDESEIKSQCSGNQLIDYGKNKKNVGDFILTLNELK